MLAIGAIGMLLKAVPQEEFVARPADTPSQWRHVLADGQLLRLNYGIFALHAALMALFVQVPFMLRDNGVPSARHWLVYLPVLAASVVLMLPGMFNADRPGRGKPVFISAIAVLFAGQALLALAGASLPLTIAALVVFFTGFNLLEATLPSLISKYAPPAVKGTAVGVYSSVQFFGTFVGAAVGGWLSQHHGPAAVFGFCLVLTALWLAVERDDVGATGLSSGQLFDGRNVNGFRKQGDPGRQSRTRSGNALFDERRGDLQHHDRNVAAVEGQGERRKARGNRVASRRASTIAWPKSPVNT